MLKILILHSYYLVHLNAKPYFLRERRPDFKSIIIFSDESRYKARTARQLVTLIVGHNYQKFEELYWLHKRLASSELSLFFIHKQQNKRYRLVFAGIEFTTTTCRLKWIKPMTSLRELPPTFVKNYLSPSKSLKKI